MKMCLPELCITLLVGVLALQPIGGHPPPSSCCSPEILVALAAKCTGATPCKVCKSCKSCAHCTAGGNCGACAPKADADTAPATPPGPASPSRTPAPPRTDHPTVEADHAREAAAAIGEAAASPTADALDAHLAQQQQKRDREKREEALRARADQRAAIIIRLGERLEEERNFTGARDQYQRALSVAPQGPASDTARARIASLNAKTGPPTSMTKAPALRVVRVLDARTIEVWSDGHPLTLQLAGVEVPVGVPLVGSPDHVHNRALTLVRRWVDGREVRVQDDATIHADPFGRRQVYLYLGPEGPCLNRELIRQGLASVVDDQPFDQRDDYVRLEQAARRAKRGIWATPQVGSRKSDAP